MKNTLDKMGRTLSGKAQAAERLAALSVRRSRGGLRRFMESMDGNGFEFHSLKTCSYPRS